MCRIIAVTLFVPAPKFGGVQRQGVQPFCSPKPCGREDYRVEGSAAR